MTKLIASVKINQTSISKKDGIELTTKFTHKFSIAINRYDSVGDALARINKVLFYEITEGKRSGTLKGLSLKFPFLIDVKVSDVTLVRSSDSRHWGKTATCGVSEKRQNAYGSRIAEQLKDCFVNKTGDMLGGETYTTEDSIAYKRLLLNENIVDYTETLKSI